MSENLNNIKSTINDIINSTIGKPDLLEITDETELVKDLGFSSLDFIILLVEIEERFNITIEAADISMDTFTNIASLIQYINKSMKGKEQKTLF